MTGELTLTLSDGTSIGLQGTAVYEGVYAGSPVKQISMIDEETGKTASIILGDTKWNDLGPCWNRDMIDAAGTQGTTGTQGTQGN